MANKQETTANMSIPAASNNGARANTNNDNTNGTTDINKLNLSPATLEALKTLSSVSSSDGIERLRNCDKLTASLEQIRANKNTRLFEKLDKIRQDFTGLNHKLAQMEESILDLKEVTSKLVKSLPPDSNDFIIY